MHNSGAKNLFFPFVIIWIFYELFYNFAIPFANACVQFVNGLESQFGKFVCGRFASCSAGAIYGHGLFLVQFFLCLLVEILVYVNVDSFGEVSLGVFGFRAHIHQLHFLLFDDFGELAVIEGGVIGVLSKPETDAPKENREDE